jgi:20S proteasome subunit beta 1
MSLGHDTDWMTSAHSMGTTIMAIEFKDGVILGADSRTSTGMLFQPLFLSISTLRFV